MNNGVRYNVLFKRSYFNILSIVRSYTTRKKENTLDKSYRFIDKNMANELMKTNDIVAHTQINGDDYFTLTSDFDPNKHNAYLVDAKCVEDVKQNCPDWNITVLKMFTNENQISADKRNADIIVPHDDDCDLILERKVIHQYYLRKKNVRVSRPDWSEVL